jgi:hypothetical protein
MKNQIHADIKIRKNNDAQYENIKIKNENE